MLEVEFDDTNKKALFKISKVPSSQFFPFIERLKQSINPSFRKYDPDTKMWLIDYKGLEPLSHLISTTSYHSLAKQVWDKRREVYQRDHAQSLKDWEEWRQWEREQQIGNARVVKNGQLENTSMSPAVEHAQLRQRFFVKELSLRP
jgi:hypothetical protein